MKDKFTVLIFGAGQIGSRHLQGLAKSSHTLRIYVVDINLDSLRVAKQRWKETFQEKVSNKIVSYHNDIAACPKEIDLVIHATTATKRVDLVASIKDHAHIRFWILEKVLVQSSIELDRLLATFNDESRVWVNLPRRGLKWHSLIRAGISQNSPFCLKVSGKSWGLACNSVHYLDMLSWFSGEYLTGISIEGLNPVWIKAKRTGYWEVIGELKAEFSGGSTATLNVEKGENSELWYQFELLDNQSVWIINEEQGIAIRSDGYSIPGKLPYQSEVTPLLVDQILSSGECELPTLNISAQTHRVFLDALLNHWRRTVDPTAIRVPIT